MTTHPDARLFFPQEEPLEPEPAAPFIVTRTLPPATWRDARDVAAECFELSMLDRAGREH